MALEEIASTGDTQALAKTNAVIRAAKELTVSVDGLYPGSQERPGDTPVLFTSVLTGSGKATAPIETGDLVPGLDGMVLRVAASGPDPVVVASRTDQACEIGVSYMARAAVRRNKNSSDPLGDAIQFGIACLNANKQKVSERIFFEGPVAVADGLVSRQVTFSRDQAVDLTLSETTRYVRAFVRIFGGDGIADVSVVGAWETNGLPGPKGDVGDLTPAAQAAADEIKANTGIVEQKTSDSAATLAATEAVRDAAALVAQSAGVFRAATLAAAITAGRTAVDIGKTFTAVGDDVETPIIYKKDSATTQTEVVTLPSKAQVDRAEANVFPIDYLPNPWPNGDLALGNGIPYAGSAVQESIAAIPELVDAGVAQGFRPTPAAGSFTGGRLDANAVNIPSFGLVAGEELVIGCLVYSSTGATFPTPGGGFALRIQGGATIAADLLGFVQISPKLRMYYAKFNAVPAGTLDRVFNGFAPSSASFPDAPGVRYLTGFYLVHGPSVPIPTAGNWRRFTNWKAKPTRKAYAAQIDALIAGGGGGGGSGSATDAKLVLGAAGQDSYVEVQRAGKTVRRTFNPFPATTLTAPSVFDPRQDIYDGKVLRSVNDDPAPYRVFDGQYIGARHGYHMGDCTAASHGKVQADIGSIYTNGGKEYVLVGIKSTGALYLTSRLDNAVPPTGTYAYVSGGSSTSNITVTASVDVQMYPPFQNRKIRCLVDGVDVTGQTGTFVYRRSVVFAESYDVLPKAEVSAWFIANGASGSVQIAGRTPAFSVSFAHTFDIEANYTLPTDFIALQAMTVNDIMFTQAQRSQAGVDGTIKYYVPKALSVTHGTIPLNYAMIDSSDTTGWPGRYNFSPDRCEPSGILCDRLIELSDNYGFAIGYLPIGVAAVAERRSQITLWGIQIHTTLAKVYMGAVNKGDFTANKGQAFSAIPYRVLFERSPDRTCLYAVRTEGDDYLYVDWHNKAFVDRVPIPADYVGRSFEIVEKSANVALLSNSLTSSVAVDVNAAGAYGYLILKIK